MEGYFSQGEYFTGESPVALPRRTPQAYVPRPSNVGTRTDASISQTSATPVQRHYDSGINFSAAQQSQANYMTLVWVGLAAGAIYYILYK